MTTDVIQPVKYILIHIYNGTIIPNFSITTKNIQGTFTIIESTRFDPFNVTNFSNFVLSNDCANVQGSTDFFQVFFRFDGLIDKSNPREEIILSLIFMQCLITQWLIQMID